MCKIFNAILFIMFLTGCTSHLPPEYTYKESKPKPLVAPGKFGAELEWHKLKDYKNKIDFKLVLVNNTNEGIDLSKAYWKFTYNKLSGQTVESDFDGVVVPPNSRRGGVVIIQFQDNVPPNQDFEITIDNLTDMKGIKLPPVKISGKLGFRKAYYL